jgi:hypothetical protein
MTMAAAGEQSQWPTPAQDRHAKLSATLNAIETMELDALRALWAQSFGTPPALRSTDLMRLMLSWRLQARSYGGLDAAIRRKLRRKTPIEAATLQLDIGSTLSREWQGQIYEVEVVEDGFRCHGQIYPSLSAAASAITGTRWNGPKFFGLRKGKA